MRLTLTVATALMTFCAAQAQAGTMEYDCDTKADHFSQIKMTQTDASSGISGKLTALTLAKGKTYVPVANVRLENGQNHVSIRMVTAQPGKDGEREGEMLLGIVHRKGMEPADEKFFAKAPMQKAVEIGRAHV
jgi:hypothetical protein